MKIIKHGTGILRILFALLISTNAWALDECLSGVFENPDKAYTGASLNFQDDGVAYGYWWGLVPADSLSRPTLPHWFQLYGTHQHLELDPFVIVAEMDIGMAYDGGFAEKAGKAYLFPVIDMAFFTDAKFNPNKFVLVWELYVGADGNECEITCEGELHLERITQPMECNDG